MKNATFLNKYEVAQAIHAFLATRGYDVSEFSLQQLSSKGATVVGPFNHEEAKATAAKAAMVEAITDELTLEGNGPMSVVALANAYADGNVECAARIMSRIEGLKAVAPARENGKTVSLYMSNKNPGYEAFVAAEKEKVESMTDALSGIFMKHLPAFHEEVAHRPQVVAAAMEANPDTAESLALYARAVFYNMAEKEMVEHTRGGWRIAPSEEDIKNIDMLKSSITKVLGEVESDEGISVAGLTEKIPGDVEESMLGYAIRRMENVYEQHGNLHIKLAH